MADAEEKAMDLVHRIVSDTLESRLDRVRMVAVEVEEEHDADGEPVLHVTVVYKSDESELDGATLSGLVRHLRPALSEYGEYRFPVMSFVAAEERAATA